VGRRRNAIRILIVGVDGNIGGALARHLRERGDEVYGTSRRFGRAVDPYTLTFDLSGPSSSEIELPDVDVAVFCAAMARFKDCREQPAAAMQVNVTSPVELAARVTSRGGRAIVLSTSAVFDSTKPQMSPDAATCPVTEYGKLKAAAEQGFLALGSSATVFRLTKVIEKRTRLFANWRNDWQKGGTVSAFSDHFLSPISLDQVVEALAYVISSDTSGVVQISGEADVSYADVARHLAEHWSVHPSKMVPISARECGIPSNEVLTHTTLDAARLRALTGFQPPNPYELLDKIYA
jgi:dTDP-4-dehydrorhamnose reductase